MQGLSANRAAAKLNPESETRVSRLIVEFMLRQGHSETAKVVSSRSGIDNLLDIDIFIQCKRIVEGLISGNTQECLAWCNEHKSALRKSKVCTLYRLIRTSWIIDCSRIASNSRLDDKNL